MAELFAQCTGALVLLLLVLGILAVLFGETEEAKAARLRTEYEQKSIRLREEAEVTRAEIDVIQATAARDLIISRVQYFRSLSKQERALLEARLRASAEAEARARHQLNELEAENYRLSQQLGALTWDGKR
jgi:hypothetical protein